MMALDESMRTFGSRIETALDHWLPPANEAPEKLHEAMRYSVLSGGKRVRPLLLYLAGTALGVPASQLDGPAVAVEIRGF